MNQESSTLDNVFKAPASTSIGSRLRTAREAMRLHATDVASQLHLNLALVEAIERDDFSNVPSKVFMCGYLRSYAKLVNLPAKELVAQYEALGIAEPKAQTTIATDVLYPKAKISVDFLTPWIILIFLIASASLLFFWWRSDHNSPYANLGKPDVLKSSATALTSGQTDFSAQATMNSSNEVLAQPVPAEPTTPLNAGNVGLPTTAPVSNQVQTNTTPTNTTAPIAGPMSTPASTNVVPAAAPVVNNPAVFPVGANQQPVTNATTQPTDANGNPLPAAQAQTTTQAPAAAVTAGAKKTPKVKNVSKPKNKAVIAPPF